MLRARSRDHALRLGDNVAADDDDDDEDGDAGKMTTRSVAPEVRPRSADPGRYVMRVLRPTGPRGAL